MANAKLKCKSTSSKDILVSLCIVIGAILIALYCFRWYQVKQEEKYINSYLISTNTISQRMNDINDIKDVLSETPNYYFVYISYTKDKDINNFEKKLKPLIDEYTLQNNFYYIDVTDIKETNTDYKNDIAKELKIESNNLKKIPVILYFKDGSLNKKITTTKDFEKLLKEEDIKSE